MQYKIITISRELGSGGRIIGKKGGRSVRLSFL